MQAGVTWSSKETVTAVVHIYSDSDFEDRVPRYSDFEDRVPMDSDFAQVVSSELEMLLLVFSFHRVSLFSHVSGASLQFQSNSDFCGPLKDCICIGCYKLPCAQDSLV